VKKGAPQLDKWQASLSGIFSPAVVAGYFHVIANDNRQRDKARRIEHSVSRH